MVPTWYPNLSPGTYQITASAQGFVDTHTTVVMDADGKLVVNLVNAASGRVRCRTGTAGSSTMKGDVTNVRDLPLMGVPLGTLRRWSREWQPRAHRLRARRSEALDGNDDLRGPSAAKRFPT